MLPSFYCYSHVRGQTQFGHSHPTHACRQAVFAIMWSKVYDQAAAGIAVVVPSAVGLHAAQSGGKLA
eukprot:3335993-Pleurochrysis_carterae.AAC.1